MAKKKPVPAKSHQYVKRQKKFIEMPMDKFWKIVASVAAVIVAIVLFFVLRSAFDGHLNVVDGVVQTSGDNWIVANTGTAQKPRYFKVGEAGEVAGFARSLDENAAVDKNVRAYTYKPDDAASPVKVTVMAGADAYDKLPATLQRNFAQFMPGATMSEVSQDDVAGKRARSFSYTFSYPTPDLTAEATPEPDAETEPGATPKPQSMTYTKAAYAFLAASHGRSVMLSATASDTDEAKLPGEDVLKDAIARVAAQTTIE